MIGEVRLMTWNVNGLRACVQRLKKRNLRQLLDELDADILCFQETKMTRSELDEDFVRPEGYDAFYSFCRVRSGYSGVVTFCRSGVVPTVAAEEGLSGMWPTDDGVGHIGSKHHDVLNELESEGRCVITDHQTFVLVNVYCPATRNSERLDYKIAFHDLLQDRVLALQKADKRVIVVGDINIAHRELDHCEPEPFGDGEFGDHPCRQWMDRFAVSSLDERVDDGASQDQRLVDSFRHFHPNEAKAYTCWSMVTAARQTNYGTRIDYILVDPSLLDDSVTACSIEPTQMGSDHCPVVCKLILQFAWDGWVEGRTASLCAKYYTEFAGKQQTLKSFLTSRETARASADERVAGSPQVRSKPQATGPSSRKPGKLLGRRSFGHMSGSAQRSIKAFFGSQAASPSNSISRPAQGAVSQYAIVGVPVADTASEEAIDMSVWNSFLGSKKRLAEEEQNKWKQVLSGQAPKTPLCHCGEPTVLRTVLKTNENWGRKFYVCTRPEGEKGHPDARCEFFQWVDQKGNKRAKS